MVIYSESIHLCSIFWGVKCAHARAPTLRGQVKRHSACFISVRTASYSAVNFFLLISLLHDFIKLHCSLVINALLVLESLCSDFGPVTGLCPHGEFELSHYHLDAQFFMYVYVYFLHVSGSHVPIIRRIIVSVRPLVYVTLKHLF